MQARSISMNWKQARRTENNIDRLYPSRLVEEYRKTVRGLYKTRYGEDGFSRLPDRDGLFAFCCECLIDRLRCGHCLFAE